jgi:hypothetical protein
MVQLQGWTLSKQYHSLHEDFRDSQSVACIAQVQDVSGILVEPKSRTDKTN